MGLAFVGFKPTLPSCTTHACFPECTAVPPRQSDFTRLRLHFSATRCKSLFFWGRKPSCKVCCHTHVEHYYRQKHRIVWRKKQKTWNFITRFSPALSHLDTSKEKEEEKRDAFSPFSPPDWWMLTDKTLWQAAWLNQLQQAHRTLSVMEQPHADTLIEIQTESNRDQ